MNKVKIIAAATLALCTGLCACGDSKTPHTPDTAPDPEEGTTIASAATVCLQRSMQIADAALANYMEGEGMKMARFYNPFTNTRSEETGSVWMYTSSIEAVNAILHALESQRAHGDAKLYDANFGRYKAILAKLYAGLEYYRGTFTLTSYTQTRNWDVYAVNRGKGKGEADVTGVLNVYDDQMWLIRELIASYRITGEASYLVKAEYLADYVLDGWDCTLDVDGCENGGITWGPGYFTKHSCSNGPLVSPLVWLHEIYKDKPDQITYRIITPDSKRQAKTVKKSEYYLNFAKSVYDWQKRNLLVASTGVYDDFMGGGNGINYETVDGVTYRANTRVPDRVGPAYSYNSGTMLSGASDLYRATADAVYLSDLKALSDKSFAYFAKPNTSHPGLYDMNINGFSPWFNGVLMRAYADAYAYHPGAATSLAAFKANLDYGFGMHLRGGMLPTGLIGGWNNDRTKNNTEGMFQFTYAAEYAILAQHELNKN